MQQGVETLLVKSTVEPPNKGRVGTLIHVHYSEVVLYWEVSANNYSLCYILGHPKNYYTLPQ